MPILILLLSIQGVGCPPCEVAFTVSDTLGSDADPGSPGPLAEVLRMSDGGYLVSSASMGTLVIHYDSAGGLVGTVGRRGEGPGEFRRAVTFSSSLGSIVLMESRSDRLHMYDLTLEHVRTVRLPGPSWSIAPYGEAGWLVAATSTGTRPHALHVLDDVGTVQRSIAPLESPNDMANAMRQVASGSDGSMWSVTLSGKVELHDPEGSLRASLQIEGEDIRELPPGTGLRRDPRLRDTPPPAMVTDLWLDDDGLAWVFFGGPDAEWTPSLSRAGVSPERVIDTLVYLVRYSAGALTVVGDLRLDTLVRPLANGWAFDLVDLPSGDRKVRVGRLELRER